MKKQKEYKMTKLVGDAIDNFYRRLDTIGMVCDIVDMEVFVPKKRDISINKLRNLIGV